MNYVLDNIPDPENLVYRIILTEQVQFLFFYNQVLRTFSLVFIHIDVINNVILLLSWVSKIFFQAVFS